MPDSMFEELLTTMDSILSQSAVLLRSATALSNSLLRGQALAKTLRLEVDDTILDPDPKCSRQDLDRLLEPCGVTTPVEDRYKGTAEVLESSGSLALRSTLSPVWSTRISHIREGHSINRSRLGVSTIDVSDVLPPAKRNVSTTSSHLGSPSHSPLRSGPIAASQNSPWSDSSFSRSPGASFFDSRSPGKYSISAITYAPHSPARLPTPAATHNAWVAKEVRTPSMNSPVW